MDGNRQIDTENARLSAENELFKSVVFQNESSIYVIQSYRVVFCNPSFSKLTGYSDLEVKEILFLDIVHPKDRKLIKLLFQNDFNEIKQRKSNSFTLRILTKFNEFKWIKSNVSVIVWDGKPALLCSSYDITQQKESENNLVEEEQNFRLLVNAFGDFVFIVNHNGNIVQVNQSVLNSLGYLEHEILLESFAKLHIQTDRDNVRSILSNVLGGVRGLYTSILVSRNGKEIPVEVRMIKGLWSRRDAIFAIAQDIGPRLEAERVIKESEEKFSKAFNTGAVMMTISTFEDGKYLDVNDAFLQKVGLTKDEVIGRTSKDIDIFVDINKREELKDYLVENERVSNLEIYVKDKQTGNDLTLLLSAEVVDIHDVSCILATMNDITLRKQMEEEILRSRVQMKGILDNLPFIAWLMDNDGHFLLVNKSFTKYFGVKESNVLGKSHFDFWPKHWATTIRDKESNVIKTRTSAFWEEMEITSDGEEWWEHYITPVIGRGNRVIATTGIARRITEQKLIRLQIEQNLERQKLLTEVSYLFNTGLKFEDKINLSLKRIGQSLGLNRIFILEQTESSFISQAIFEWYSFDTVSRKKKLLETFEKNSYNFLSLFANNREIEANGETLQTKEIEVIRKTCQAKQLLIFPLSIEGRYIGIIGIEHFDFKKYFDSNEREFLRTFTYILSAAYEAKLKEEELRISEQRFRSFSESLPEMVFEADENQVITFTNNNLLKAFGFRPKDLDRGIKISDLFVEVEHTKVREYLAKSIRKPDSPSIELIAGKRDSSVFPILSHISRVRLSGRSYRYIGVMVDISQRKKQESELLKAKEQAEEASRAKERFLSTMSHEIRTPMNAVIGMTNLLLQESPKQEQLSNLNALKYSAENLLSLLNDILDFSKIEAGKLDLIKSDINLHLLHAGFLSSFAQMALEKGLQLKGTIDSDIPNNLVGDRVRLNQVLNNLVGNAIKFTQKGKVELNVNLQKKFQKSVKVRFIVSDTGIGIKKELQELIFQEFTQVHSQVNRYGGTGLGLAISKKLVNLMGGEIFLKSSPGKGATFYFDLKFDIVPESKENQAKQEFEINLQNIGNYKVLIVEDNELNTLIVQRFLSNWGVVHDHAENGLIALEKVRRGKYDLILMDLEMPEMNGYEAAKAIRGLDDSTKNKIPIIALSASAMQDVQRKIFNLGMNDFVLKPFNPADLKQKIFKYLAGN